MAHWQCCCDEFRYFRVTLCGDPCPSGSNPYTDVWLRTNLFAGEVEFCPPSFPIGQLIRPLPFGGSITGPLGDYTCSPEESCCWEYTGDCVEDVASLPGGAIVLEDQEWSAPLNQTCEFCCPVTLYLEATPCPVCPADPEGSVWVLSTTITEPVVIRPMPGQYCYEVSPASPSDPDPPVDRIRSPGVIEPDCASCCCFYVANPCPECPNPDPDGPYYIRCEAAGTGEYVFELNGFCYIADFDGATFIGAPPVDRIFGVLPGTPQPSCPECCPDPEPGCGNCTLEECGQNTFDIGIVINNCENFSGEPYTVTQTSSGPIGGSCGTFNANVAQFQEITESGPGVGSFGNCDYRMETFEIRCGDGGPIGGICQAVPGPEPEGWYLCALFSNDVFVTYTKDNPLTTCPNGSYSIAAQTPLEGCSRCLDVTLPGTIVIGVQP